MLSTQRVTSLEDKLLESAWTDLVDASREKCVFWTREWFQLWWRFFGMGSRLNLFLIKDRDRARTLVPLMFHQDRFVRRVPGLVFRCLQTPANYHSNRVDFPGESLDAEATEQLWDEMMSLPSWLYLRIFPLPEDFPNLEQLKELARRKGLRLTVTPSQHSPFLRTDLPWDEFQQSLSKKTRLLARKGEELVQQGVLRFVSIRGDDSWPEALEDIFELSTRTWAGKQGTSIASSPELRGFYSELARIASRERWLHIGLLKQEDRTIAFDFNLIYEGRFYNLKGGYDPDFAHLSPGHLLSWFQLSEVFQQERGVKVFDFLGDADPYKFKWTDTARSHVKVTLFRPGSVSAAALHLLDSRLLQELRKRRGGTAGMNRSARACELG